MWGEWDVADGTCGGQPTPGPARHLHLNEQHQQQTNWCWAASTVSITAFYEPATTWTQCTLVNKALGQTTCCSNGSTSACNQPWYADQALQITGHYASTQTGKSTIGSVVTEISAGRPISIVINWTGGGGHNPVIDGYDNTNPAAPTIDVQDPWYGYSIQDFNSFPGSYQGGGTWWGSFFTKG